MIQPMSTDETENLDPVHELDEASELWTGRLVVFLRVMAGLSMFKGLYHWSRVCGIGVDQNELFAAQSIAWQAATVFFAVIDLVAAVGLWLAAAWGAVVWLTSIASMAAVDVFFPGVFGHGLLIALADGALLALYLWLAVKAALERPE